jgi:translation elongation factor EF-1beta
MRTEIYADIVADDETDMKGLEESVRSIEKDGLVWGASKLVPVGFGIKKLQINLVIEDDKIGLDDLQEEIAGFEDYVQSTDIVSYSCHTVYIRTNSLSRLPCKSYRASLGSWDICILDLTSGFLPVLLLAVSKSASRHDDNQRLAIEVNTKSKTSH